MRPVEMLQSTAQLEPTTTLVIIDDDGPENFPDSWSLGCAKAYRGASRVHVHPVHETNRAVIRKLED